MSAPETYALTYDEAKSVGKAMDWLETPSWKDRGDYGTTRPGRALCRPIEPYRMTAEKWLPKITGGPT